jgi:hypothetical protein
MVKLATPEVVDDPAVETSPTVPVPCKQGNDVLTQLAGNVGLSATVFWA